MNSDKPTTIEEVRAALSSDQSTPVNVEITPQTLVNSEKAQETKASIDSMLKDSTVTPVTPDDQRVRDEEIEMIRKDAGLGVAGEERDSELPSIVVSSEEKAAFIDAVVFNRRFTRSFEAFSGKVTGEFRCRTVREQQAIASYLQSKIQDQTIKTSTDYLSELQACSLAAQVSRLNDVEFPPLPEPLFSTLDKDSKLVPPAWLSRVEYWKEKENSNLPLVVRLFKELRNFEVLYWTLVKDSEDANF